MAVKAVLVAGVFLLLGGHETFASNVTQITFTGTDEKIMENNTLILTCAVSGSFDPDNNDTIQIQKIGSDVITIATQEGPAPGAPDNVNFLGYILKDGLHKLLVAIKDITPRDHGDYRCEVLRLQDDNTYKTLGQKTVSVDVLYKPSGNPLCAVSPERQNYQDGDKVTLQCKSESGNPPVPIKLYRKGNETSSRRNMVYSMVEYGSVTREQDGYTILDFALTLMSNMSGVTFNCVRQTGGNFSLAESCSFGPLPVENQNQLTTFADNPDTGGSSTLAIGGASGAAVLVIIAIVVIVGFVVNKKKKNGANPEHKKPTISDPVQVGNKKVSDCENGTVSVVDGPRDGPVYAEVKKEESKPKAKGKEYPEPPDYPRPPKLEIKSDEKPYENAEIGPTSPTSTDTTAVYENPQDIKSGASIDNTNLS